MAQYSASLQSSAPSCPQSSTTPSQTAPSQSSQKPSRRPSSIIKLPSLSTPRVDLSNKLGRDSKLNDNEHKCCIDNNLYLYCGSKDHKVDGCPRKQLVRARLTTLEEQETPLSKNLLETRVQLPRLSTNWESRWTRLCNYESNASQCVCSFRSKFSLYTPRLSSSMCSGPSPVYTHPNTSRLWIYALFLGLCFCSWTFSSYYSYSACGTTPVWWNLE